MARLVVISGPVFSNKTARLKKIIDAAIRDNKPALLVSSRNGKPEIFDGSQVFLVDSTLEIEKLVEEREIKVLGFEDCHLFRHDFLDWIDDVLEKWKNIPLAIIIAGLDLDWQRRPFGPMPDLLARADVVIKLAGRCELCQGKNGPARFTKKNNGSPKQIETGGKEMYQAACRACHTIPMLVPSKANH